MKSYMPLVALAAAVALVACDKAPEPEQEAPQAQEVILQVRTVDKTGAPVEMVRFYINGKKFGITDQDGAFKGRYPAKDGELLTFNVEAPAGYSVPANIDQSRWRHQVKYPGGRPLQLNFTATLQRPERDYLFMINAKAPAVPVTVNAKVVGKTGTGGEALLIVRGEPGAQFAARAGSVILNGEFAEDEEVYLLTAARQGAVGGAAVAEAAAPGTDAVADAVPTDAPAEAIPTDAVAAAPETVAAAAETVAAAPETVAAAPVTVAAAPETLAPVAVVTEPPAPVAPETVAVPIAPEAAPPRPVVVAVAERNPPPQRDPFAGLGEPAARPEAQARVERDPPPTRRRDPVVEDQPIRQNAEPLRVERTPEPAPLEVEPDRNPPPQGGGIDDLLIDPSDNAPPPVVDVQPETPPVARIEAPLTEGKSARQAKADAKLDDRLIDDGDVEVGRGAAKEKTTVGGGSAPVASTMGREEISQRLEGISSGLEQSGVLKKADVDFLGQVDRTHPGYFEANRLLAEFYYQVKDPKRQSEALEVATAQGRYKHDPTILLSLAKAYAQRKNYGKALGTMRRVEEKMRNLPAVKKADAYRFYAEILEFEFLRQYDEDPKGSNVTLLDKAIEKWERYRTFSQGVDAGAVGKADKKIKELQELKQKVEF